MIRKSWIKLGLTAMLTLSITACGTSNKNANTDTTDVETTATAEATQAPTKQPEESPAEDAEEQQQQAEEQAEATTKEQNAKKDNIQTATEVPADSEGQETASLTPEQKEQLTHGYTGTSDTGTDTFYLATNDNVSFCVFVRISEDAANNLVFIGNSLYEESMLQIYDEATGTTFACTMNALDDEGTQFSVDMGNFGTATITDSPVSKVLKALKKVN